MAAFKIHKVVYALPSPMEADAVYCVRAGTGFDLYVTDSTGSVAHKVNGGIPDLPPPIWQGFDAAGDMAAPAYHGQLINCNAPSPGSTALKRITGGRAGQMFTLRPAAGMSIEHGSPIRLRGAKSLGPADGLDSNKIIELVCLSGNGVAGSASVWAEKSRNF